MIPELTLSQQIALMARNPLKQDELQKLIIATLGNEDESTTAAVDARSVRSPLSKMRSRSPSALEVISKIADEDLKIPLKNTSLGGFLLITATELSKTNIIENLLARKVHPDSSKGLAEPTSLAIATTNRDVAITTILLRHGANPNQAMQFGITPRQLAEKFAREGDSTMIECFTKSVIAPREGERLSAETARAK